MCEWVDVCPSTGVRIEKAPCKAIERLIALCATDAGKLLDQTPSIVRSISSQNWRVSLWSFLRTGHMWEKLASR